MTRWTLVGTMAVAVCLAGFCSGQEKKGKTKTVPENQLQLKPLAYFIGNWELTGEVNMAGQEKAPFVFEEQFRWDLGNNFIQCTSTETKDGKTDLRHRAMIGWDAKTQQIKSWGFWNPGAESKLSPWAETVIWVQDGGKWRIEKEGVDGLFTIIDKDTHKYECTFRGDDGSNNSWHFTAKRKTTTKPTEATQTKLPENVAKELGFFVGDWTAEGYLAAKPLKGRWSTKWAPQKQCLLTSCFFELDGEKVSGNGVSGWDSSKEEVVTTQFLSNGVVEEVRYKIASPGVLKGIYTVSAGGEPLKVDCEVSSKQRNEWTLPLS